MYFRIFCPGCSTTPGLISTFSVTAPTSSNEGKGLGLPGLMPCVRLLASRKWSTTASPI